MEMPLPPIHLPEEPSAESSNDEFLDSLHYILDRKPRFRPEAIKDILAVDAVSGHVLVVCNPNNDLHWVPYMYLRWACDAFPNKKWLDRNVLQLMDKPIPPHLDGLPRMPILDFHRILLIYYIPRLNDGTAAGSHERIIYRLWGKGKLGSTTLRSLSGMAGLNSFVRTRLDEIRRAGRNKALLSRTMGLTVRHDDLLMPIVSGVYPFPHLNFGVGSDLRELERSAVAVLTSLRATVVESRTA